MGDDSSGWCVIGGPERGVLIVCLDSKNAYVRGIVSPHVTSFYVAPAFQDASSTE